MDKIALRNDFPRELCGGDLFFTDRFQNNHMKKIWAFQYKMVKILGFLSVSNKYRVLRYVAVILYEFYPMKSSSIPW